MSDLLKDLAKKGCKILSDTKTPRKEVPKAKAVPQAQGSDQILDIHQAAVKRFIKDKPSKKHLLEFFEKVITAEEAKL
jgi:hypothetical protein